MICVTASIMIGNSDNKLTQCQWSEFVAAARAEISHHAQQTFFQGFSATDAPWQNACWVVSVNSDELDELKACLARLAQDNGQDSIALVLGKSELILSLQGAAR